jgi:hypothetical protein
LTIYELVLFPTFTSISFDEGDITAEEMRALSLLALGSIYMNQDEKDIAYTFLSGARNTLADSASTSISLISAVEQLLEETGR